MMKDLRHHAGAAANDATALHAVILATFQQSPIVGLADYQRLILGRSSLTGNPSQLQRPQNHCRCGS